MVDLGTKYFNSNPRRSYSRSLIQPANTMSKKKNSAPPLTIASGTLVAENQSALTTHRASQTRSGVDRHRSRAEH